MIKKHNFLYNRQLRFKMKVGSGVAALIRYEGLFNKIPLICLRQKQVFFIPPLNQASLFREGIKNPPSLCERGFC